MNEQLDISVILCTYNRSSMLPRALESVLAQNKSDIRYEVIVVDNNSPDETRAVVESFIARGHRNLRYIFESRQGLSHARNTGIENASAPIIAFFDDDERVASDWIASIKRAFDEHAEVDYIGGKVLPRWETEPPQWLTNVHWSPLAIVDWGDTPFYSNAENPTCMVGGNLSFRRGAFERVGLFDPTLQRVKDGIGSCEDHELQLRLWRAGRQGMYAPAVSVTADVQTERLTKAYHRRWHSGHGRYMAVMGLYEEINMKQNVVEKNSDDVTLFGVPGFLYRKLIKTTGKWGAAVARGQKAASFDYENRIRFYSNYIRQRAEQNAKIRKHSKLAEIGSFIKAIALKKTASTGKNT